MCIAAITGRVIFDEISREHDPGVRDPCHDVARGVTSAELYELHLAFAKEERHLAFEGERRPSQTWDALCISEQPWKAAKLRFPILLPALGYESMGLLRGNDPLGLVSRCAQYANGVIVREDDVFDRLVGDGANLLDHLPRHSGCCLRVEHRATIV